MWKNGFDKHNIAPKNIDWWSAPPQGYIHYLDVNLSDPFLNIKEELWKKFQNIQNILVFQKEWPIWELMIRFSIGRASHQFKILPQDLFRTLTNSPNGKLVPFLQSLTPEARWIYNETVNYLQWLKKKKKETHSSTHAFLDEFAASIIV